MKRIYGLDVLRALAISLVIVSHCTYILFPRDEANILVVACRSLGAIGVDLFFVLSGFLIGGILLNHIEKGRIKIKDLFSFWKRRWFRTLPNYYLILIVNILLIWILKEDLEKHLLLFFPFLQNFVSPHPDFFTEAWSLSVEEYAYLILPLLMFSMFVLFRNIPKHKVFLYATLISILVLVIPKLNFYFNHSFQDMTDWSSGYRKVVLYRLDSIYLGFLVVYLMKYFNSLFIRMRTLLLWSGLVLFAGLHLTILMFKLDPENYAGFFVWVYLQTVMLSLALIFPYFATLHSGILKKLVIFVSLRSYAMYLVNYSIVLLTLQRIADFQLVTLKGKIGFLLLYLLISTGISMLIYTYFEKPILRYRDNNIKRI